jgi:hypothetical protein
MTQSVRSRFSWAETASTLFYAPKREWRSDMTLATSIIPCVSLWLYYYEVWLVTGEWEGGGGISHEPKLDNDDVSDSSPRRWRHPGRFAVFLAALGTVEVARPSARRA